MDKRTTRRASQTRTTRGITRSSPPPAARTRSKSPARITRSPARDKPKRGRPKKNDTPTEEISSSSQSSTPVKNINRKKMIIIEDSDDNEEVVTINTRTTRLASLRNRLTPTKIENNVTPSEEASRRSMSRSVSSLTKEESDDDDDDDEDEYNIEVEVLTEKPVDAKDNFGGSVGSGILLALFIIIPIILQYCYKNQGDLNWSNIASDLKNPLTYCNSQAGYFFLAFLSSSFLLTTMPVGRMVTISANNVYSYFKFTGFFNAFVILAFLLALENRRLDLLAAIYNNIDQFLYLNIIVALLFAGANYAKSRGKQQQQLNPYGRSGKFLIDFFAGAEINPKLFNKFDLKSISYHRSIIMILLFNIVMVFKNVTLPATESAINGAPIGELIKQTYENFCTLLKNSEYNNASLVVSVLLICYALDLLIFEHHLTSSFELNHEACGAELLLRHATFPFLVSFLPRFLLKEQLQINKVVLIAIAIVFIAGLVIKRGSNKLKYEYRMNPADPKFRGLTTLPTFQSRRLIISSWFKLVRQPNYAGEILMHLSLLVPLITKFNFASFAGIVLIVVYLIFRSIRVNKRNARKYETSWRQYSATIKYNLLPKVY
ncbi:unnamed protein product [Diamesa hyperborea]